MKALVFNFKKGVEYQSQSYNRKTEIGTILHRFYKCNANFRYNSVHKVYRFKFAVKENLL